MASPTSPPRKDLLRTESSRRVTAAQRARMDDTAVAARTEAAAAARTEAAVAARVGGGCRAESGAGAGKEKAHALWIR